MNIDKCVTFPRLPPESVINLQFANLKYSAGDSMTSKLFANKMWRIQENTQNSLKKNKIVKAKQSVWS